MLSFDPRALMTPGGVINGAGNAIAALANVPANKKRADALMLQQQLAVQALQQKQGNADRDFGLRQSAQQYTQSPTNPANAHLQALDANMAPPLTFEQRKQLAEIRGHGAQPHQQTYKFMPDGMGGVIALDPMTGQPIGHTNDYAPGAVKTKYPPITPQPQAQGQIPQSPAIQALSAPGGAPAIPRAGAAPVADEASVLARIKAISDNPNASNADLDELERLMKQLGGGAAPTGEPDADDGAQP